MKKYSIVVALVVLVFTSLACQAFSGIGKEKDAPSSVATSDSGNGSATDSQFPMTRDAYNVTNVGDNSILFYTKMSVDDVMKFYRDEYTAKGYTENKLLTVVNGGIFSMVFDGDPSGKQVVIQSVDLGDGSRTIAIRLE